MDSSVYTGNQKHSGRCSALAALGTLTYGPRVSDFPYTHRTHRLTDIYSYLVEQVEELLSQFEWKSRDSPTETRLTDRYRSTDSLSFDVWQYISMMNIINFSR